jgi:tRNA threonylcarbamoyladenosine biosynthesis protein TsaB
VRILAFDTSTDWLSVACGDATIWHVHDERAGHAGSERILPAIDAVLARARWELADLDGIAFGAGPGAFTGLRIACGVAQGLAFGAGKPVVAVPSTVALAQAAWRERGATRVFACIDARMREVYVAAYLRAADAWCAVREPAVLPPADVELPEGAGWFGAGDGFAAYPRLAALARLDGVDAGAHPSARAIGELALPRLAAGQGVAAGAAHPLYVRHRVALTTAERDAGERL